MTSATSARLRRAASIDAPVVATLPLGTTLRVLERSTMAPTWYRVRTSDERTGWILGSLTVALPVGREVETVESIVRTRLTGADSAGAGSAFDDQRQLVDLIERALPTITNRVTQGRFVLHGHGRLVLGAKSSRPRAAGPRSTLVFNGSGCNICGHS